MWIIKPAKYTQQYVENGEILTEYEKGIKCTCSYCGWKTGSQGKDFVFCPMCGKENYEQIVCDQRKKVRKL